MAASGRNIEGWLIKKKAQNKSSLFGHDSMRWFRLQEVQGSDQSELALCYFKSQREKEARGWIYLKDITQITDTAKTFTVVSAARTMTIEAQTPAELVQWLRALVLHCPNADTTHITTNLESIKDPHRRSLRRDRDSGGERSDSEREDPYRGRSSSGAGGKGGSGAARYAAQQQRGVSEGEFKGDESESGGDGRVFSRNAPGDKSSFFYASGGNASGSGDLRSTVRSKPIARVDSNGGSPPHSPGGGGLRRGGGTGGGGGGGEIFSRDDFDDHQAYVYGRGDSTSTTQYNSGGSRSDHDRDSEFSVKEEERRRRGQAVRGDNGDGQQGNRRRGRADSRGERGDHRRDQYSNRSGDPASSGTSSRLHRHIAMPDSNEGAPAGRLAHPPQLDRAIRSLSKSSFGSDSDEISQTEQKEQQRGARGQLGSPSGDGDGDGEINRVPSTSSLLDEGRASSLHTSPGGLATIGGSNDSYDGYKDRPRDIEKRHPHVGIGWAEEPSDGAPTKDRSGMGGPALQQIEATRDRDRGRGGGGDDAGRALRNRTRLKERLRARREQERRVPSSDLAGGDASDASSDSDIIGGRGGCGGVGGGGRKGLASRSGSSYSKSGFGSAYEEEFVIEQSDESDSEGEGEGGGIGADEVLACAVNGTPQSQANKIEIGATSPTQRGANNLGRGSGRAGRPGRGGGGVVVPPPSSVPSSIRKARDELMLSANGAGGAGGAGGRLSIEEVLAHGSLGRSAAASRDGNAGSASSGRKGGGPPSPNGRWNPAAARRDFHGGADGGGGDDGAGGGRGGGGNVGDESDDEEYGDGGRRHKDDCGDAGHTDGSAPSRRNQDADWSGSRHNRAAEGPARRWRDGSRDDELQGRSSHQQQQHDPQPCQAHDFEDEAKEPNDSSSGFGSRDPAEQFYGRSHHGSSLNSNGSSGGAGAVAGGGTSRPPRPPTQKAPYSLNPALLGRSSSGGGGGSLGGFGGHGQSANMQQYHNKRSNTPPRQAADPGSRVDPNFADADWDAEAEAGPNHRAAGGGGGGGGGRSPVAAGSSSRRQQRQQNGGNQGVNGVVGQDHYNTFDDDVGNQGVKGVVGQDDYNTFDDEVGNQGVKGVVGQDDYNTFDDDDSDDNNDNDDDAARTGVRSVGRRPLRKANEYNSGCMGSNSAARGTVQNRSERERGGRGGSGGGGGRGSGVSADADWLYEDFDD